MRCHFHLSKGDQTIRDDRGIEVADLDRARAEAIKAIAEMRDELADESSGWTLTVTDDAGVVLFTIPLDLGLRS